MRRKPGELVLNEKRFLMGGLDLTLQGKTSFWSGEILNWMDSQRNDGKHTGPGTIIRASQKLHDQGLLDISDGFIDRRRYFQLTADGMNFASLFYIQEIVAEAEDFTDIAVVLRYTRVGQYVLNRMTGTDFK